MPSNPKYDYDIFISYKSEDRAWAQKLYDDLQARRFKVFLDDKRLQAGLKWEPQLGAALNKAGHLVVLWSAKAYDSPWVRREIGHFDARITAPPEGASSEQTRMVFVLLEGEDPQAYDSLQMIADLRSAGAYPVGAAQVNPNLWTGVVGKVEQALRGDQPAQPVLLAIVTMTQAQVTALDPTKPLPGGFACLNALLTQLAIPGLQTQADLIQLYGPTRAEWCPLGSNCTIKTLLDEFQQELNQLLPKTSQIRWEIVGDDFWQGKASEVSAVANRLASQPAVVIIDPLAFYDADIHWRFSFLFPVFDNPSAVVMALPPFSMLLPYVHYRSLIEQMANEVFKRFAQPSVKTRTYARCNVNIVDRRDIKQWLLSTLGAEFATQIPEPVHGVLQTRL